MIDKAFEVKAGEWYVGASCIQCGNTILLAEAHKQADFTFEAGRGYVVVVCPYPGCGHQNAFPPDALTLLEARPEFRISLQSKN